jgi:hypothetical protein
MAIAKFHSFRGEKSALILVKKNAFVFGWSCAYVPRVALPSDIVEGTEFAIPDGYTLVDMIGEDGTVRVTKDGECLKVLSY